MKTSQLAGVPKLGGIEGGLRVVAGEQAGRGLEGDGGRIVW